MGSHDDKTISDLRRRLLSGKLDDESRKALYDYIASHPGKQQLSELMEAHWSSLEHEAVETNDLYFNQLRNRLWKQIEAERPAAQRPVAAKPIRLLLRLAAVLTIPLLITSAFLFYRLQQVDQVAQLAMQEVYATPGSRVHFTLPDQTEVWLNSGSKLEYSGALNQLAERRVKLSGQGYFKVKHDAKHPFYVETPELQFKVLGTAFDVSSYADDEQISSTLEEGSIAVLDADRRELLRLEPGQQAFMNRESREIGVRAIDPRLCTSWKDGRLVFNNTPISEVVRQLERWYNCSIHAAPEVLNSGICFTGKFTDETLAEVLTVIGISTPVHTKIQNREVFIWNQ